MSPRYAVRYAQLPLPKEHFVIRHRRASAPLYPPCYWQALLVIGAAQVRRRVSAPLRLAACALYGLAGAPKEAAASLAALDIKFILHDTLTGHWLLPLLLGAGAEPADVKRCVSHLWWQVARFGS